MSYVCENSVGPNKTCDFRSGKVILQRSIDREQVNKLLTTGKTDLLERFISRKGRPFKAYLVLTDKKDVGFEFEKRDPKAKRERKPKEPAAKIDFTGKEPVGKCPKCGRKILETENSYICERSQADRRPCKFKLSKTILGRDIPKEQAQKLLAEERTDLLDGFISKRGRPFSAYLKSRRGRWRLPVDCRESQSALLRVRGGRYLICCSRRRARASDDTLQSKAQSRLRFKPPSRACERPSIIGAMPNSSLFQSA